MKSYIEVIIPSHKRQYFLLRLLNSIKDTHCLPKFLKVTVLLDGKLENQESFNSLICLYKLNFFKKGKVDKTYPDFEIFKGELDREIELKIIVLKQRAGQATARNIGIFTGTSEVILFLDDDVQVTGITIMEHAKFHLKKDNLAVIGKVAFPKNHIPDLKQKLADLPCIYREIEKTNLITPAQFLTCNLSIKRKHLLKAGGFNINFKNYGYEDIELGYRLAKAGIKLIYSRKAMVYHFKAFDNSSFKKKFFDIGRNSVIFEALHPQANLSFESFIDEAFKIKINNRSFSNSEEKLRYYRALGARYELKKRLPHFYIKINNKTGTITDYNLTLNSIYNQLYFKNRLHINSKFPILRGTLQVEIDSGEIFPSRFFLIAGLIYSLHKKSMYYPVIKENLFGNFFIKKNLVLDNFKSKNYKFIKKIISKESDRYIYLPCGVLAKNRGINITFLQLMEIYSKICIRERIFLKNALTGIITLPFKVYFYCKTNRFDLKEAISFVLLEKLLMLICGLKNEKDFIFNNNFSL